MMDSECKEARLLRDMYAESEKPLRECAGATLCKNNALVHRLLQSEQGSQAKREGVEVLQRRKAMKKPKIVTGRR
jgi:hypothetical protein